MSHNTYYSISTSILFFYTRDVSITFSTLNDILLGPHGKEFTSTLGFLLDIYHLCCFGVLCHAPGIYLLKVGSGNHTQVTHNT